MPHPGRGLREPEHLGGLAVGKVLEVPQEDDFAVILVQLGESRLKPNRQLSAKRRGRGRQARIFELRGQVERRLVKIRPGRQRTLAIETAALRLPVPAMLVDDMVTRNLTEPEMERKHRVLQVLRKPLIRLEQHFLNDVTRINPAPERSVEPEIDQTTEPRPVSLPEAIRCAGFRTLDSLQ